MQKLAILFMFCLVFQVVSARELSINQSFDCKQPKQGPPGPEGPTGPTGPTGPAGATGPAGPAGSVTLAYGAFFTTDNPTVTSGNPVPINQTSGSLNTSLSAGNVVIALTGDYMVTYGVSALNTDITVAEASFKLTLNGSDVAGSFTSANLPASGGAVYLEGLSVIVHVTSPASTLSIVNSGISSVFIAAADGSSTSAYVSLIRLGDALP